MGVLEQPAAAAPAPYLRIAAELRARIASGEIRTGEKVPSVRQIAQEWGIATATAGKVLSVLRAEGLVRAVPGVGTVVAAAPGGAPGDRTGPPPGRVNGTRPLTRDRIVRTAVALADARGGAALSMRALAAELRVPTMALYRHVPGKGDLVALMADAVFAEAGLSGSAPAGWRGRLEAVARHQWSLYRRHPWLARTVLPATAAGLMEWAVSPALRQGLEPGAVPRVAAAVAGYVRGVAVSLTDGSATTDLDALFTFGLARLLDGVNTYIEQRPAEP